jgi:branched-chain amino acid transport system ATP-binding protein
MLVVNKINVFYGDLQALWDVSLTVEEGEIVVIIGANAAGKTTLINTITGFLKPRTGRIDFLGKRIDQLPPNGITSEGLCQVPEGRNLFRKMTVFENLEMGAFLVKGRNEISNRIKRIFGIFPILEERKNQTAGTLSGGEAQMLALGRALMSNPKLLILDEPSLGLAPKVILTMFDIIKEVNQNGVTIVLVEQNLAHALEVASRGYVLENGRIVLEDAAKNLKNNEHVKKAYLGY